MRSTRACDASRAEVRELRDIYDDHAGLRDRFAGAGIVTPELARAARAHRARRPRERPGARPARRSAPWPPYDGLDAEAALRAATATSPRASRALRRDRGVPAGCARDCCASCPPARCAQPVARARRPARSGIGLDRGLARAGAGRARVARAGGRIRRCHPHDPSWQNWPVLEHAVIGNIVPDFPLINKSFNLSYSGHDL